MSSRKKIFKKIRRIVVKVGSGVLAAKNGLNNRVISGITKDISVLRKNGIDVILVSSGAIASGMKKIGLAKRPATIFDQQATAAVGQASLMMAYENAFARHDLMVAQILITRDDLNHRGRYLNARNTVFTLLSWNIIPIINENDTVVADEIQFGDNDNLSAMVTNMAEADLLVLLTDMDGLFDKNPREHKDANIIPLVKKVDRSVMGYAGSLTGTFGTGGMVSKLKAAQQATVGGIPVVIANGHKQEILTDIFAGKEVGTFFMPQDSNLCRRKQWIAFTKAQKGKIIIDQGASNALQKRGKSLLPSGIIKVIGRFSQGDSVLLLDKEGQQLAVGMVNYPSGDINKIAGIRSSEIESVLGYKIDDEVIHRDNLVVIRNMDEGGDICQLKK
ncbi:MAG: glutamate 5-kinase [Deltaproteobacteria bacterium]|nr:glutamate 5-kinase [Deltaproteobacteria bacterium]